MKKLIKITAQIQLMSEQLQVRCFFSKKGSSSKSDVSKDLSKKVLLWSRVAIMSTMQLYAAGNKEDPKNHLLRVYHAQSLKQRVPDLLFLTLSPVLKIWLLFWFIYLFIFGELLQLLEDC